MTRGKLPYAGTKVSVISSLTELQRVLDKRGIHEFSSDQSTPGVVVVRFGWTPKGCRPLQVRLAVDARGVKVPRGSKTPPAKALEAERMRKCRVLVFYVKGVLDAVAGGLGSLEEAFLQYIEDPSTGRTVAEIVGPTMLALPPAEPVRVVQEGPAR